MEAAVFHFFVQKHIVKAAKKLKIRRSITMKMKIIYKNRMRKLSKTNGILHISRCIVNRFKTELQYTFFNVEFWMFLGMTNIVLRYSGYFTVS